ncbi:MAG: uroporphyrinogen-III synthase [Sulfurovaceae bacterium]|nr:uroporphyrinogen-III synthase [Sulfurovaceae bacterium]MDD5548094.1 uroporphyrinogen-III synthase [Sulfurovaceae bacterium]
MIYLFSSSKYDDVLSMPIIEFKTLQDSIDLSNYDLLLFTSKNAVVLMDEISKEWKNIPSIAIGKESAEAISKLGGNVTFVSNGYSENLSYDIKQKFANKKILYIRPKVVATKHITDLTKENIDIDEFILYETICKKYDISQKPPLNSVLIFTSPSTIECFINNFKSLEEYKIVVIGETTAKALPQEIKYHISNTPNINECIKLALKL